MSEAARKYLIFQLAGQRFAFDLAQIAEVIEPPETWPIPMAPRCYTGAANFHGTIVASMDLATFMDLPANRSIEKCIVIDTRIASLALLVEQVLRIVSVDQTDLHNGSDRPFAAGELKLSDGPALLLDAVAIAERASELINT